MSAGRYRALEPLQIDGKRIAAGKVVSLEDSDATEQLVRIGAVVPAAAAAAAAAEEDAGSAGKPASAETGAGGAEKPTRAASKAKKAD